MRIILIGTMIFILTSCSFEESPNIADPKSAGLRDSAFSRFIKIQKATTRYDDCIIIKPSKNVLMGTCISITLDRVPQNTNVTLHAYRRNWEDLLYSFACFKTDGSGQIQLNKDKPISATYPGADSLGVFWSMTKPTYRNEDLPFEIQNMKINTIYFQLEADGRIIAKNELQLIVETPDISCEEIRNNGIVANFYRPKNEQHVPLIIMLGGSNGGMKQVDDPAKIVASHGYGVLALAYFAADSLPQQLERIPVEYFFNSIQWAKEKHFIDTNRIVILGISKGAEAALLVASMRRDIKGAIAFVPSNVRWQGIPNGPSFVSKSSWTFNGKDLPFLKCSIGFSFFWKFISKAKQIELREIFKPILTAEKSEIEPALIEVEKINGPILLIAGKDDKVWPSYEMCQMMKDRLDSLQFEHHIERLNYDHTGHFIFGPDLMPTIEYHSYQINVGGKDSENCAAQIDSWNKMLDFLQTYFPVE